VNTAALSPGHRIKANVKGQVFCATLVERQDDGRWLVADTEPRSTYLHLRANQIVERVCACRCAASLAGMRADARYGSEACEKRHKRRASTDKAPTTMHPLAEARARQESSDLKSKLSQIIYEGIIDRLKRGPVHADDLEPLFPPEVRSTCRRLVGAQFGSLASRGYIVERERRKSKVKSRKGAKSGVFIFTAKGRAKLVGADAGVLGGTAGVDSGEKAHTNSGNGEGQAGLEIAGSLDRPGADLAQPNALPGAPSSSAVPDESGAGGRGQAAIPYPQSVDSTPGVASSELTLVPDEVGPEPPRSAFTRPEAA